MNVLYPFTTVIPTLLAPILLDLSGVLVLLDILEMGFFAKTSMNVHYPLIPATQIQLVRTLTDPSNASVILKMRTFAK
ncbi:Hypothetical predicted protein, partial [Paramuricea clavata]